jgi:hypothetical protein
VMSWSPLEKTEDFRRFPPCCELHDIKWIFVFDMVANFLRRDPIFMSELCRNLDRLVYHLAMGNTIC